MVEKVKVQVVLTDQSQPLPYSPAFTGTWRFLVGFCMFPILTPLVTVTLRVFLQIWVSMQPTSQRPAICLHSRARSRLMPSRLPPTYPYGLSLLCFFVRSCTCGFARIKGCRRLFIAASANSGAGEACHIIRQGIGAWRAFHTKQAKKRLVGRERHGFASAGCQRPLEVCSVWVLPAKSVAIQQLSQSFSSALPCKGPSPARCACAGCSPSASRSCASPACATLSS